MLSVWFPVAGNSNIHWIRCEQYQELTIRYMPTHTNRWITASHLTKLTESPEGKQFTTLPPNGQHSSPQQNCSFVQDMCFAILIVAVIYWNVNVWLLSISTTTMNVYLQIVVCRSCDWVNSPEWIGRGELKERKMNEIVICIPTWLRIYL